MQLPSIVFDSYVSFRNIFHSFVWTLGTIILTDKILLAIKKKQWLRSAVVALCGALTVLASIVLEGVFKNNQLLTAVFGVDAEGCRIISSIFGAFVTSPLKVEYSIIFILLGLAWYYIRKKLWQCSLLLCLCLVGTFILPSIAMLQMISGTQWAMVGAIPVIALYNGRRGRGFKAFFYIYYPLHCYVLAAIGFYFS